MNPNPRWPSRPDSLRKWQVDRLRRYLRRTVLPFSTHYRALFEKARLEPAALRSPDDLRRIPFTTKSDFLARNTAFQAVRPAGILPAETRSAGLEARLPHRQDAGVPPARDFVLIPDKAVLARRPSSIARALVCGRSAVTERFEREFRPLLLTSTTGRSSAPVPFLYTAHDIDNLRLGGARIYSVCGAQREMRMLNMFPFAPHLAFWLGHYGGTEFGTFVLGTGGGKTMGTDGNLRLIRKIKPDVLIGMPTFIYHLLSALVEEGFALPNLRKIVLGGEKAPSCMRRKLREFARELGAKKVDVLRTYGFTEAKMAWAECPFTEDAGSAGYHVHPDLALIEIVDPKTGEPRDEGEPGEIVCTPLDARGTVALRFRTGDCIDGGLFHEPCPYCGLQVPRLVGEISRTSEIRDLRLGKLKGTLVDFNHLEHVLDDAEHVGTWQLEIRKRDDDPLEVDELILHVAKSDGTDDERLRGLLGERFASETEIHPNRIEFHPLEELQRLQGVGTLLKEQRVVDHRPVTPSEDAVSERSAP